MASISYLDPQIDKLSDRQLALRVAMVGLCSDAGTDEWFPPEPRSDRGREEYERKARRACVGCAARPECLILALRYESLYGVKAHGIWGGIWGGMAPWERRRLARALRRRRSGFRLAQAAAVTP